MARCGATRRDKLMKIVIVGGVAGGMSAATRMRRLDADAEIVVLEKSGHVSYANCGLPYYVGGVIEEEKDDEDDAQKKSDYFMDLRRRKQEAAKARAELLKNLKEAGGNKRTCPALNLWMLSQCEKWSPSRGMIDWQSFLKTIAVHQLYSL